MRHRPPRSWRHVGVAHGVFHMHVRKGVRRVDKGPHPDDINPVPNQMGADCTENRLLGLAHGPGRRFPGGVERGSHADQSHRSIAAVLNILFPGPY